MLKTALQALVAGMQAELAEFSAASPLITSIIQANIAAIQAEIATLP